LVNDILVNDSRWFLKDNVNPGLIDPWLTNSGGTIYKREILLFGDPHILIQWGIINPGLILRIGGTQRIADSRRNCDELVSFAHANDFEGKSKWFEPKEGSK
jgi:hypothetical protein